MPSRSTFVDRLGTLEGTLAIPRPESVPGFVDGSLQNQPILAGI
jgi:hypothetical protein